MFISPQVAIDNGWITGIVDPQKQVQPNAIDFTLDTVYSINRDVQFAISEESKTMRGGTELLPSDMGNWFLTPDSVYDCMSSVYVDIPEGVACELIVRSTLSRNGLYITSGMYDSFYQGHVGFALHNRSGPAKIHKGTRVGQIKFIESDNATTYNGSYNHKKGTHWADK